MKFAVKIVLIIFIAFLSTPTIVSLIEKSNEKSYYYDLTEEDHQSEKEILADFAFYEYQEFIAFATKKSSLILSENLSKHDNISAAIFIPPPEQI